MKPSLVPGVVFERRLVVDESQTIGFMGEAGRVYATPALVWDVERTCRDGLLEHLDAGEDSVGTRIELDHLAPTLLGMAVAIRASVLEVKGRLVTFEITARDPLDDIARGKHMRFVADVQKTVERLKAKAAKAKAAGAAPP
ncbi:MAG TPA: hotdog domain-containing protein [Stellaceae bacterium]|nr:hotdog domain-containing protein [Stellaceae bacterium]